MTDKQYSFVVVKYKGRKTAGEAIETLKMLERDGALEVKDAVAVYKNGQGKVKLAQSKGATGGKGSMVGGSAGLLVGLLLGGGPIALAMLGALAGGAAGKWLDTGIKDKIVKQLGDELVRDDSALCVLVRNIDWPRVEAAMQAHGGRILVADLTDDMVRALAELAENEEISATLADLI